MRLFAGERIYKILDRLGTTDEEGNEEPIEAGMLSKQIEKAQRKVEEQHFLMRKHTLEYDDVLNQQREVIYTYRDEILEGRDMSDAAREEVVNLIERLVERVHRRGLRRGLGHRRACSPDARRSSRPATAADVDRSRPGGPRGADRQPSRRRRWRQYDQREEELGDELMRALERFLLLQIIDQRWREHLYDMDYLREGIHLRGLAQIDPLVAYKNEAFELFGDLMNSIWGDFARMIYHVEVTVEEGPGGGPAPPPVPQRRPSAASSSATGGGRVSYSGGTSAARAPRRWRRQRPRLPRWERRPTRRTTSHCLRSSSAASRGRAAGSQRSVLVRVAVRSSRNATARSGVTRSERGWRPSSCVRTRVWKTRGGTLHGCVNSSVSPADRWMKVPL